MKILVTGSGSMAGSWPVRGLQLGGAIGADVIPKARGAKGYDVAIVVKRNVAVAEIHKAGVPLVYDIVDAWPQPVGNTWSRDDCLGWLRQQIKAIRPAGIVAATRAMATDCAEFGIPVLALPHHARPGLLRNPIRPVVQTVGYEGSPKHIGSWAWVMEGQCKRRGWRFVMNPSHLADVDIVVAMREATGYAPRRWKSNVKLANAQGSGTPCIVNREAGYIETASGGECWADTVAEVEKAFDLLTDERKRQLMAEDLFEMAIPLSQVAKTYLEWLTKLI